MQTQSQTFPGWSRAIRLALCLLMAASGAVIARADDTPAPKATVQVLNLDGCIAMALQRQQNIQAARASLNAAAVARDAANAPLAGLIGPQIIVRRKQADLGVAIATAAVEEAELDTIHAVTRCYVTVLFAQEQHRIAREAVAKLSATSKVAESALKAGSQKVTTLDRTRIETYVRLGESRVIEAEQGILRAKAALREAIGAANDCTIEFGGETLDKYYDSVVKYCATHGASISCCAAVEVALNHRPELRQGSFACEIARLEVQAQKLTPCLYAKTFAATSDIHSRVIPGTEINGEYRPGGLAPEMPTHLAGTCSTRACQATHLADRAVIALEKQKGLVALEVEDACLRLQEEASQVPLYRKATTSAVKLEEESMKALRDDQSEVDKVLSAQVVEANTKSQLNETMYRYTVALAALQRATAGKLWNCLDRAVAAAPAGEQIQKAPTEQK